jgi:hypothetical protein
MTTKRIARCAIYEDRPQLCRDFPTAENRSIPQECTFQFIDGERFGECDCGVGACCAVPRVNGDPEGDQLPADEGGLPCQHLVCREVTIDEMPKTASDNRGDVVRKALER